MCIVLGSKLPEWINKASFAPCSFFSLFPSEECVLTVLHIVQMNKSGDAGVISSLDKGPLDNPS